MGYKFEKLEVWQLALEYDDLIQKIIQQLPRVEEHNLASQLRRASTSIYLNIAEGSTSQSDAEQARFINIALRSLVETVACQHAVARRNYLGDVSSLREAYLFSEKLFAKLQAFRNALFANGKLHEEKPDYQTDTQAPF